MEQIQEYEPWYHLPHARERTLHHQELFKWVIQSTSNDPNCYGRLPIYSFDPATVRTAETWMLNRVDCIDTAVHREKYLANLLARRGVNKKEQATHREHSAE